MTRPNAVVFQLGIRLPGGLATFGVPHEDAVASRCQWQFETLRPADLSLVSRHGHRNLSQFPRHFFKHRLDAPRLPRISCHREERFGAASAINFPH